MALWILRARNDFLVIASGEKVGEKTRFIKFESFLCGESKILYSCPGESNDTNGINIRKKVLMF